MVLSWFYLILLGFNEFPTSKYILIVFSQFFKGIFIECSSFICTRCSLLDTGLDYVSFFYTLMLNFGFHLVRCRRLRSRAFRAGASSRSSWIRPWYRARDRTRSSAFPRPIIYAKSSPSAAPSTCESSPCPRSTLAGFLGESSSSNLGKNREPTYWIPKERALSEIRTANHWVLFYWNPQSSPCSTVLWIHRSG